MRLDKVPKYEVAEKTANALRTNGIIAHIVKHGKGVKKKELDLIPEDSEVMDMTSETLNAIGISKIIQGSGKYFSARKKAYTLDLVKNSKEIYPLHFKMREGMGNLR